MFVIFPTLFSQQKITDVSVQHFLKIQYVKSVPAFLNPLMFWFVHVSANHIHLQPAEHLFLCWNVAARGSTTECCFFRGWQRENWFSWSKINAVMNIAASNQCAGSPSNRSPLEPGLWSLRSFSANWIFSGFFDPESRPWMLCQQCTSIHRQMNKQHLGNIWRYSWTGLGLLYSESYQMVQIQQSMFQPLEANMIVNIHGGTGGGNLLSDGKVIWRRVMPGGTVSNSLST